MRGRNEHTLTTSRRLRADPTNAEKKLWYALRNRQICGLKFVRQEPIGRYTCDFVCREKLIVIDVDGGQHAESKRDAVRDRYLSERGYRVLRYWNNDVLSNLQGVLESIASELG
jgi:very-short-patch-repair endonuclease